MFNKSLPGPKPSLSFRDEMEVGHRRPLWIREFKEAGPDAVRQGLKDKTWPNAKKIIAREWLETVEAEAWQAERPESQDDEPYFRDKRWWAYIVGGVFVVFALMMLRRVM